VGPSFLLSWGRSLRGDTDETRAQIRRDDARQTSTRPHLDGAGLRFETTEHGGEYPDTIPQAIKLIDAEGRSSIYVPITQNGKVVDSQGYSFDPEDVI